MRACSTRPRASRPCSWDPWSARLAGAPLVHQHAAPQRTDQAKSLPCPCQGPVHAPAAGHAGAWGTPSSSRSTAALATSLVTAVVLARLPPVLDRVHGRRVARVLLREARGIAITVVHGRDVTIALHADRLVRRVGAVRDAVRGLVRAFARAEHVVRDALTGGDHRDDRHGGRREQRPSGAAGTDVEWLQVTSSFDDGIARRSRRTGPSSRGSQRERPTRTEAQALP